MRPRRLEIRNFRGWKSGALSLDGPLTLLVAQNRRGKSSTLNALEWCMFGKEVEKKLCGISERADWQAQHRSPSSKEAEAIEVALTLATDRGEAKIVRRRESGAGARMDDVLSIETPAGERLDGARAEQWMRTSGLPDWDTWRRAFCQHQEIARSRLTEGTDRSSVLALLLGLEEYDRLNAALKEQKPANVIKALDGEQEELEKQVLRLLLRPEEDLTECEQRLAALGVDGTRVSPKLAIEIAQRMIARARKLAGNLGVEAKIPECTSEVHLETARAWAESWAASVRGERRSAERVPALHRKNADLTSAIARLEPLESRWKEAREQLERQSRDHGDEPTQASLVNQAEAAVKLAEDRLRAENAALSLLREARELLRTRPDPDRCPVCDTRVPELTARVDSHLASARGERMAELEQERQSAKARLEHVNQSLRDLRRSMQDETDARTTLEKTRASLTALVPHGRLERNPNLLASAREEARAIESELKKLETALAERDRELEEHRKDLDILRELQKWQAAAKRAEHRTALDKAPAWSTLQTVIDQAAGYAVDLDALAVLSRVAQEEHSSLRESEVNRSLGAFFAMIIGDESGQSVRVKVKRTAKGLTYDLEDEAEERALSTLNQASLNALSLALLFAQAEERARTGLPAWLVLDDPAQSLDDEHQAGLARAIERVATSCPVIVAMPPSPLAERLLDEPTPPRRAIRLAPWDPERGVRVLEEDR